MSIHGLLGTLSLAVTGCSQPPDVQTQSALATLERARAEEAAVYAAESFRAAEQASLALQAELDAQAAKFVLLRSYETAARLASDAQQSAELASVDAEVNKERVRSETHAIIVQARVLIDEERSLLSNPGATKLSATDLARLQVDVGVAEHALRDAEQSLAAGDYLRAKSKAVFASVTAQLVKLQIDTSAGST